MTEDELLALMLDGCEARGLPCFHSTDPRRDTAAGFPDLAIRSTRRGVLVAELKTDDGVMSQEQRAWARSFRAGCRHVVLRASDWPGECQRLLDELRG